MNMLTMNRKPFADEEVIKATFQNVLEDITLEKLQKYFSGKYFEGVLMYLLWLFKICFLKLACHIPCIIL